MTGYPPGLQPVCARCRHRHRPSLRCWGGRYVRRVRAAVFARYGDTCHLCGQAGADTVDHLIPRSTGGTDDLDHLRPAHRWCNTGRGAAPLSRAGAAAPGTSPRW